MDILYLCSDSGIPVLGRKGSSVHIRELSAAFTRAGHNVIMVSPVAGKSPWEPHEKIDAKFFHMPLGGKFLESITALKTYTEKLNQANLLPGEMRRILYDVEIEPLLIRKFKKNPPDIIYVRASLYATAGVMLAKALKRPLFVELNSPLTLEQTTYRESNLAELSLAAEHKLLTNADAVFTVSSMLSEYVINLGVVAEKIHVLPNGIDTALFYPKSPDANLKDKYHLGDGPILGFVGGLRPWHGVQCFPDLLSKMIAIDSRTKLMLVGDGPLKVELKKEFKKNNLSEHVIFTGSQPYSNIPDLIRLFTIALAPYPEMEHDFYFSPLKLFEYMGCGIPVVAAEIGQIKTIIKKNETGITYSPGNHEALLNACKFVLENKDRAKLIGQQAAKEVHEKYTWDSNVSRIIDVARSY